METLGGTSSERIDVGRAWRILGNMNLRVERQGSGGRSPGPDHEACGRAVRKGC